jgi:hypothetical protein
MKYRKINLFVIGLFLAGGFVTFAYMQKTAKPLLKFTLKSEKTNYKLGEPINFIFELKNESNSEIIVLDGFNVGESTFLLEVSSKVKGYTGCNDHGWGLIDSLNSETKLIPKQYITAKGNILWVLSAQEMPLFRFKESGKYIFRANYIFAIENGDAKTNTELNMVNMTLESEPIEITLEEPEGEDLEVWNKIKDDGNFAYFIQKGDFLIPIYKTEEREKFKQKVEQILNEHPNSFYAESLKLSLAKFRTAEAQRQSFLKKVQP